MSTDSPTQFRRNVSPKYETGEDGRPNIPPPITSDIHVLLSQPNEYETDSGTIEQHDKVVDQRFPLLTWIRTIERNTDNSSYSSMPSASPASLIGYMQVLTSAFYYFNDFCHSMAPSPYAHAVNNDSRYSTFFEALLDCNVPGILAPEFSQWQTTFDPISGTYRQVTSLAATSFAHDFGRQFPASIFFALHNLQASLPPNAGSNILRSRFWTQVITTLTMDGVNYSLTPSHYFGYLSLESRTANAYPNWLNQAVDTLLTTNHIRTTFGTVTIRRLPLEPMALANLNQYNPYLYLTGFTELNDLPLRLTMQNLSSWIKTTFPSAQPLRNYVQRGSGPQIQHLVFRTALPTWHTQAVPPQSTLEPSGKPNFFEVDVHTNTKSRTQFSEFIHFCPSDPPTPPTTGSSTATDVDEGELQDDANTGAQLVQLVKRASKTHPKPDNPALYRSFDPHTMNTPNCRIVSGQDEIIPSSYSKILTSGILIETNDISMIGLPTPNPNRPLHMENTRFTLGSILIEHTRNAFTGDDLHFYIRRVELQAHRLHSQLFVRGPSHRLLIPTFLRGFVEHGPARTDDNSGDASLGTFLPGSGILNYARRALDVLNVFSRPQDDSDDYLPTGELVVWSSYRYRPKMKQSTVFILPTMDHIIGINRKELTSRHLATRLF
ncbi:coat protein [Rhizoctonia solani partitivirus 433]|nr:coat protein [Rhizoctonia solani partitivirus 433]WDD45108.1 coat protein [Rhizoctonia solani virus JC1]